MAAGGVGYWARGYWNLDYWQVYYWAGTGTSRVLVLGWFNTTGR